MATRTSTKARGGRGTLTASMLGSLPPGDHTDTAVKGLQLRVRDARDGTTSRVWLFRFAWRGEGVRISIGRLPTMTLADARARALELRSALDEGIDPRRARPRRRLAPSPLPLSAELAPDDRHSVDYLCSEFSARYLQQRKHPRQAERMLAGDVLRAWGGRDARTITSEEVLDLLDGIVARGSPVAANRTASLLGLLFRFGVQRRIVPSNPVQLLMPPGGREAPRKRRLSEEELRVFLADPEACTGNRRIAHVAMLLLITGQRRGELARAMWRHVDFKRGLWTIPDANAKNEHEHLVPLSAWAVDELRWFKQESGSSPWVLPGRIDKTPHANADALTTTLSACLPCLKEHGLEAFRLHDLRRTCRTNLSRLKVEPHIAERVLNHKQKGVVGVYDLWQYIDEKREALDKWAAYLEGLRALGPPPKAP